MSNRILICILTALTSGIFGFWAGGQVNLAMERSACEARPWGFNAACKILITPGALWKGSTTGLWMGTILGAIFAGVITRKPGRAPSTQNFQLPDDRKPSFDFASLRAHEVILTPTQEEVLSCLTVLLTTQAATTEANQAAAQPPETSDALSLTEARQLLMQLGFSEAAIAQAWRMYQAVREGNEKDEG